jgi:hypothetical protein
VAVSAFALERLRGHHIEFDDSHHFLVRRVEFEKSKNALVGELARTERPISHRTTAPPHTSQLLLTPVLRQFSERDQLNATKMAFPHIGTSHVRAYVVISQPPMQAF